MKLMNCFFDRALFPRGLVIAVLLLAGYFPGRPVFAAATQNSYCAHKTVEDRHGVIASWRPSLSGLGDFCIRTTAETLKRYPWHESSKDSVALPEYMWNPRWEVAADGTIKVRPLADMEILAGDICERASYTLDGLVDYYRYTGDPAAIAHLTWQGDMLIDYFQTPPDHPWPGFLIGAPHRGKLYGKADPRGMIQLDVTAEAGIGLLHAYQLTGNARWFEAAKHWGDLYAANCDKTPGAVPWPRHANPEDVGNIGKYFAFNNDYANKMTGGVAYILYFLDELIRVGYTGQDQEIVQARDAGRAFLRDTLLPSWTAPDTWGNQFWDGTKPFQCIQPTAVVCQYLLDNKHYFTNWRNDVRNIAMLYIHRSSAAPTEVYSGAWAFGECAGGNVRSLTVCPKLLVPIFACYAADTGDEWAREIARRMHLFSSYDIQENGACVDNIDGVNEGGISSDWFKVVPGTLHLALEALAWLPDTMGANGENHIMRTTSVVRSVVYGRGNIQYSTFDAPAQSVDVLRLAFAPRSVKADGQPLSLTKAKELCANGYALKPLPNGDCIVTIRHDGKTRVLVEGKDPQRVKDDRFFKYTGNWEKCSDPNDFLGGTQRSRTSGAAATCAFTGNQVRLIGGVSPDGGLADVYLDGVKQLVGIDCWNPSVRHQQVLYYKNGLNAGHHELRVVVRGAKNPHSAGSAVQFDALQYSNANRAADFGVGGGPTGPQRLVFGYTGRTDLRDSAGQSWRPGFDWALEPPVGDAIAVAWWTSPVARPITGTKDPQLYRYGVHAPKFTVNLTAGPGRYSVRLKFVATRAWDPKFNAMTIKINGRTEAEKLNVAAAAGGMDKALDLDFNDIVPKNGIIEIRFSGGETVGGIPGEAFIQAVELRPT